MSIQTQDAILSEIFQAPSSEIIADRFSEEYSAKTAQCSGSCQHGRCMMSSIEE